eukprot:326079-Hanusia_phi.AAC.2
MEGAIQTIGRTTSHQRSFFLLYFHLNCFLRTEGGDAGGMLDYSGFQLYLRHEEQTVKAICEEKDFVEAIVLLFHYIPLVMRTGNEDLGKGRKEMEAERSREYVYVRQKDRERSRGRGREKQRDREEGGGWRESLFQHNTWLWSPNIDSSQNIYSTSLEGGDEAGAGGDGF